MKTFSPKAAALRSLVGTVAIALVAGIPEIAGAASFAGTWTVAGVLGNPVVATSAPVCAFRQTGNVISGTCRGPNGVGPAAGAIRGSSIVWRWRIAATNARGLAGIATYRGLWGSDGVIRGTWTHSADPGISGTFTAQKLR